jgi:rhamnose transport system permease protein
MSRTYASYAHPWWQRLLINREVAVLALLVVVVIWAVGNVVYFGTTLTMTYLLLDTAPVLFIALPMTMVVVTGEIDLSVASVVGLSSVIVGVLYRAGIPIGVAALVALVVGLVCGALNGYLVAYVGLPSLAVTIGTLALFRGLAVGLLGTTAVTSFPKEWTDLATAQIGTTGIPLIMVPFVLLAVVLALVLHFSAFGRGIYDIGLSPEAADFSGVNGARTKFVLFVLTGVVSAFAGIYYTFRFGSARGDNATGLELQVIAAVLLGGVSIFGGRGRLLGVIAGVLLIGAISSALRLLGVTVNVINIIIGALLVASVLTTNVLPWASSLTARLRRPGTRPQQAPSGVGSSER